MEADQRAVSGRADRREAAAADMQAGAVLSAAAPMALQRPALAKDATSLARGWLAPVIDGRQHVIGWVRPSDGNEIRGVELETVALVSRLGGSLAGEFGQGEGYALRDDQGRIIRQVGAVPRGVEPVSRLPLATALLPGWEIAAFFATPDSRSSSGGLLWLGVLLVTLFVIAIVAGGSLLMWQARRSEDEAAQKTSFVANVSHEFKTPLTTIRLYSELLEQGRVRDAAQGNDYLRTIGRETQRLARLVNNALDFSRLEQGRKKYARETIDLAADLGRLLDTHAPRVAEAGMILKRDLPPAPVEVVTDRDAIEQIVLNLIDNACKYAAAGGEVMVSLRRASNGPVEVRVADRGPGVPLEHREQIFEKFHRVDDALTAEKGGAGLGLSIARQLARGLGGELSFVPREGSGAEFVLTLP
jgi:signal transduction histidine kinase